MRKVTLFSFVLFFNFLISLNPVSAQQTLLINEGFAGGTTPPPGWTFTGIGSVYTTISSTDTRVGTSAPSIVFDVTGDRAVTSAWVGCADYLTIYLKGIGTNATNSLLIEGWDGSAWVSIATVNPLPVNSGNFDQGTNLQFAIGPFITQIRFTYTGSVGTMALDDVRVIVGKPLNVVINEIMATPASGDGSGGEWTEFYNPTGASIDMSCWYFSDGEFTVSLPPGTIILAGGFVTVANSAACSGCPGITVDLALCGCSSGGNVYDNADENIVLWDAAGTIVDAVTYSGEAADAASTAALGGCPARTSVTMPAWPNALYEYMTHETANSGSEISMQRGCDGSPDWLMSQGIPSFGASNGICPTNNCPSALPVELIEFGGGNEGGNNILNWKTASEKNCKNFSVEKSGDAILFYEIASVKGNGTSNLSHSYKFADRNAETEINYYRLKQVDFDNTFSYSTIIAISNKPEDKKIMLFPNPVTDNELTITFFNQLSIEDVAVYDVLGRTIHTDIDRESDKKLKLKLDYPQEGIYYIRSNSNIFTPAKFIIKRP